MPLFSQYLHARGRILGACQADIRGQGCRHCTMACVHAPCLPLASLALLFLLSSLEGCGRWLTLAEQCCSCWPSRVCLPGKDSVCLSSLSVDTFPPSLILSLLIPGLILGLLAPWALCLREVSFPGLLPWNASLLWGSLDSNPLCVCI